MLGSAILVLHRAKHKRYSNICRNLTISFADSAIALTLAVELASAIMLIKKGFGLNTEDFGSLTIQIVWVVALLVMLPITTFCWQDLEDKRFELRLCVISLTFILFLITLVCRMISAYGHGQVGWAAADVVTEQEAAQIGLLCSIRDHELSRSASRVMEIFTIGGSLWVCLVVIAALARQLFPNATHKKHNQGRSVSGFLRSGNLGDRVLLINIVAITGWSVPLFWVLMELRDGQRQFAADLAQDDKMNDWSFGQILAIVVFTPVLVEGLFQYLTGGGIGSGVSRCADDGDTDLGVVQRQAKA